MNSMQLKDKLKNIAKKKILTLIQFLDFICMIGL